MGRYIARRLLAALAVLVTVGVLTFVLAYVVPGDPARTLVGIRASAADVERIREALGLNRPLVAQLADYLLRAAQGDFGYSYQLRTPVLPLVLERFPATAQLAAAGVAVSVLLGVPLGVVSATFRGRGPDRLASVVAVVLVSVPAFWLGYLLLHFLAFRPLVAWQVEVFPLSGYQPLDPRFLALPALTLGLTGAAYYSRMTRSALIDELGRDYVRTARAKGLRERLVTWRHAMRNVTPPLLTQAGLDLGFFLGGVVIIEQVFSWPGIGKLAVDAIYKADVPLIMGTVLFATVCIVVANLVVDVGVALLDPRIRR